MTGTAYIVSFTAYSPLRKKDSITLVKRKGQDQRKKGTWIFLDQHG